MRHARLQSQAKPVYRPVRLGAVVLFAWALACSGASCSQFRLQRCVLSEEAPLPEVLSLLNRNTQRVESLFTSDVDITVSSAGLPLMLKARMALEKPRRFRLVARTTLGRDELDLGSNDELYWFWVGRADPPALYYSRHGSETAQSIPFDPDWIAEALGVAALEPAEVAEGPTPVGGGRLELRSHRRSVRGEPVTKVTTVDACRGWIVEQALYDARGQLIAKAALSDHHQDAATGALLPRRIHLSWPGEDLSLKLTLHNLRVNEVPAGTDLWSMPSKPQEVDLSIASRTDDGSIRY